MAADRGDLSLFPQTSTNLSQWNFPPLEFFDATDLGSSVHQLRFRLADTTAPARFFRFGTSGN